MRDDLVVPPIADGDEWPHPLTVFTPLSVRDDRLAARLIDQYLRVLGGGLTAEEPQYADLYKPPRIEVGTEPDGAQLLRISFGGRTTMTAWDGTQERAISVVNDFGVIAADNASSDYWVTEGWLGGAPELPSQNRIQTRRFRA
jgi:hypothetical protein